MMLDFPPPPRLSNELTKSNTMASLPSAVDLTPNDESICEELEKWFGTQEWTTTGAIGEIKDREAWRNKAVELRSKLDIAKEVRISIHLLARADANCGRDTPGSQLCKSTPTTLRTNHRQSLMSLHSMLWQ
jgi:hypothetical protein